MESPLEPQSDDENSESAEAKAAESDKERKRKDKNKDKAEKDKKTPSETRIDFENIQQRILAVPVPEKNYYGIIAGKEGILYLIEGPLVFDEHGPPQLTIQKYDFKKRKEDLIVGGVTVFKLSENGEKALFKQGEQWTIANADAPPKAGEGALKLADMEVYVDPRAEWKQMYRETWRIERDFFYDPHFHGLDLTAAEQFYAPYVDGISTRNDLNYLFEEMLGNMTVGHMFVGGGNATGDSAH